MNAQSNPVETYFARAGIPYRIVGGQRFFDRKEVKDINSYLAVIVNPRDDVRLRRIINEPARKIGATTIEKIAELAAAKDLPMMEVIAHAELYPALGRAAGALGGFTPCTATCAKKPPACRWTSLWARSLPKPATKPC